MSIRSKYALWRARRDVRARTHELLGALSSRELVYRIGFAQGVDSRDIGLALRGTPALVSARILEGFYPSAAEDANHYLCAAAPRGRDTAAAEQRIAERIGAFLDNFTTTGAVRTTKPEATRRP